MVVGSGFCTPGRVAPLAQRLSARLADLSVTCPVSQHNLLCDNCHSHVAECLNNMGYKGRKWGAWGVFFEIMLHGKFVK